MIIHLVPDEKFIDGFIDHQEKYFPAIENYYFARPKKNILVHIKSNKVKIINPDLTYDALKSNLNKTPNTVIIHGAFFHFKNFISTAPKNLPIGWVFYGYEIFGRLENIDLFLAPKTKKVFNEQHAKNKKRKIKQWIYRIGSVSSMPVLELTNFMRTFRRIDFMAHWLKEDYEFIKKKYNVPQLQFVDFCYSNNSVKVDKEVEGAGDLLIGNSATFTNNHIDVFDMLSPKFIQRFKKVIIPLSYGDNVYAAKIKKVALDKFGDKAVILDNFIDKISYLKLLGNVKLAIMGHYRSQAGGNIRFFLKNGINVALYPENNIYKFYKRKGVKIHNLRAIVNEDSFFLRPQALHVNQQLQEELFEKNIGKYYGNLLAK